MHKADVDAVVRARYRGGAAATVALFERDDVSASGVADLDAGGRVVRFVEKPRPCDAASRFVSAVVVLESETLVSIPERGDLSRNVLPRLAEAGLLHSHRLAQREWPLWIDTPADLACAIALSEGGAG